MNRFLSSQFPWKASARRALFSSVLVSLMSSSSAATSAGIDSSTIDLPEVRVSADRVLPQPESWRYARIPGFEILSNASERETRRLVQSIQRFDRVVEIVWPALRPEGQSPIRLVICGRGEKFDQFFPTLVEHQNRTAASLAFQNREISTLVIDAEAKTIRPADTLFIPSLGLDPVGDSRDLSGWVSSGEFYLDHEKLLQRDYLHLLLGRVTPRPPAWLEEGLAQLFGDIRYDRKWLSFGELEDPMRISAQRAEGGPSVAADDPQFNKMFGGRPYPFLSFDDFFGTQHGALITRNSVANPWAKQSAAFVHLCLFGQKKKYQKAFLTFVARTSEQNATPEMFEACFGLTYKKMLTEMRDYATFASYRYEEFRAKKGQALIAEPARFELRDASQGEIGRIKGEVLQLIGLKQQAREELIAAYTRGERDADLLATLGLLEVDAGEDARARKFLEAAFTNKTQRQRALFELSRLRFAEALKSPAGSQKRLNRQQAAHVLEPLYTALSIPGRGPETYERIADVFERTDTTFKRQELAILGEGVKTSPTRTVYVYRTARLLTRNGYADDAKPYIDHGKKLSRSDAVRAFFEKLESSGAYQEKRT